MHAYTRLPSSSAPSQSPSPSSASPSAPSQSPSPSPSARSSSSSGAAAGAAAASTTTLGLHHQSLSASSPPESPTQHLISSPRLRYGRARSVGGGGCRTMLPLALDVRASPSISANPRTLLQRLACLFVSLILRRHGFFLLAPLIYISGMLLYMGTFSFELPYPPPLPQTGTVHVAKASEHPAAGSIYSSPKLFARLWPAMEKANGSYGVMAAWQHQKDEEIWKPCINHTKTLRGLQESNGFLIIEANGGLNQQRSSICNAVALAGLLNATLVIPQFHLNSVWQDPSSFGDIYDESYFINSLADHVRVVSELPDYIMETIGNNISLVYNFRVKAWAPASYYLATVLPRLRKLGVIRISPFANRLSYDKVPPKTQQLRCLANFQALRFAQPIAIVGEKLVDLMKHHSSGTGGKYVSVHLRFEEDMVAFSCCIYDGGEEEKRELDAARERGWRGKFKKPGRVIRPGAIRMDGKCPLTPLEVGMMLRGMGFQNDTPIFLAAGKIFKAEKYMIPLRQMFPFLQTKETLLSHEELEPFKKYSSRLAALDYTVCLHSEVFVTTQGGNFPQFLIGHRRFLNDGHSKTIKPDKRKLAVLLDTPNIGWETFSKQMQAMRRHSDSKGHELRKPSASIYTYPSPDCLCLTREDGKPASSYDLGSNSSSEILPVL